jgi:hypothetical protein
MRAVHEPSCAASLDRAEPVRKINRARNSLVSFRTSKLVNVHRFERTIGGRAYQIDVTPVGNRWRAQLRRTAGMPTAMMPFYGQTPDEAARQLTDWLTLAHSRSQPPGAPAATPTTI